MNTERTNELTKYLTKEIKTNLQRERPTESNNEINNFLTKERHNDQTQ